MSKPNLPPLPPVPEQKPNYDGGDDYWTESDFDRYATAYAEQAVRPYVDALEKIASEEFISLGEGNVDVRPALSDRDACDLARFTLMGMKDCGACSGTGGVVRDPDIGTGQECFVCGGTGTVKESFDG